MSGQSVPAQAQAELDRSMPAARDAQLGTALRALIQQYNKLQADVVAGNTAGDVTSVQLPDLGGFAGFPIDP